MFDLLDLNLIKAKIEQLTIYRKVARLSADQLLDQEQHEELVWWMVVDEDEVIEQTDGSLKLRTKIRLITSVRHNLDATGEAAEDLSRKTRSALIQHLHGTQFTEGGQYLSYEGGRFLREGQARGIGNQDMTTDVWLKLAQHINQLLDESEVDGVVMNIN